MADVEKICFVIAPIGGPDSDTGKRSDQILKHIIRPIADECGYKTIRADEISKPGIITSQIIQHIVDDPLVIADLTDWNPNVFYELAVRHALRKPLVHIIEQGQQIPFDVANMRAVQLNHRDLDSVAKARKEITNQIKAMETDVSEVDSPISIALDLQILKRSEDPEQRSMAAIMSALANVDIRLAKIETTIEQTGNVWDAVKALRNSLVHGSSICQAADSKNYSDWVKEIQEDHEKWRKSMGLLSKPQDKTMETIEWIKKMQAISNTPTEPKEGEQKDADLKSEGQDEDSE